MAEQTEKTEKTKAQPPMAVDSSKAMALCQEAIWLYPTRLALTDDAFKKIQGEGKSPTLPTNILDKHSDYSLRRVRDGYIYILTANSDCPALPSTAQADGKSWYIYYCCSDENNRYQYFYQWTKGDFDQWQNTDNPAGFIEHLTEKSKQGKTHIELNRAIGRIDIMYSEFILPNDLLHQIATNENGAGELWMKTIPIDGSSNGNMTADIKEIAEVVDDLLESTKEKRFYTSNLARDFPIGKLLNDEALAERLSQREGFIVMLEDSIGTAKDLHGYTYYLDDKRQEILKKYEYAIVTAQIIDAYAHSEWEQLKERIKKDVAYVENWHSPVKPVIESQPIKYTEPTLEYIYQSLHGMIAKNHLDDSENNIVEVLKNELGISGKVAGCNTINKIAKLPNLFNDEINNLVRSRCAFVKDNSARAIALFELYKKVNNESVANAACQYFDGLIRHLNYTTLGQQALIMVFNQDNDILTTEQKSTVSQIADNLTTLFASFKNFLSLLSTTADAVSFNMYAFDRIVLTTSFEIVVSGSYRKNGKRYYKQTKVIQQIETIYRKTGIFGEEELLSEDVLKREREKLKATRKLPDSLPIVTSYNERFKLQDADYTRFNRTSNTLDGAAKLVAFATILGFFSDEEGYTKAGRWANNAALNTLVAFGEYVAPKSQLALEFRQNGQQMSLMAISKKTGQQFSSPWQAARAGLFNMGTALAGIGVLMEMGNAQEAKYKGDEIDYWGAVSRGTGVTLVSLAPALLGVGATLAASASNRIAALVATALQRMGIAFPYLGIALILIGIIFSLAKKRDIELWIKYGFWGNSERYWGDAIAGYDWTDERNKPNKFQDQFKNSKFSLSQEQKEFKYYRLEMQRFFAITEEIKLEVIDKHHIRVIHSNITSSEIAQAIKVEHKQIVNTRYNYFPVLSSPSILFNDNEQGQAVLYFRDWYIQDTVTNETGWIAPSDIVSLEIKVTLPRYTHATESMSKFTTLIMTGK